MNSWKLGKEGRRSFLSALCGKTKTDYDVVIPEPSSIESKEVTKNKASEATEKKSEAGRLMWVHKR